MSKIRQSGYYHVKYNTDYWEIAEYTPIGMWNFGGCFCKDSDFKAIHPTRIPSPDEIKIYTATEPIRVDENFEILPDGEIVRHNLENFGKDGKYEGLYKIAK